MEMTERGKSSSECAKHRLHRSQIVLLLVLVIENTLNRERGRGQGRAAQFWTSSENFRIGSTKAFNLRSKPLATMAWRNPELSTSS
jgi:hypothetical protein